MMLIWAKLIHIAAVSVWAGGLLALPLLLATGGTARPVLRKFFIAWLSPAAFAAILTGMLLVALGGGQTDWFAAKLSLVLQFAAVHVLVARQVAARIAPAPRLLLNSIGATAAALTLAVVWVAVAKPGFAQDPRCDPATASRIVTVGADGSVTHACLDLP